MKPLQLRTSLTLAYTAILVVVLTAAAIEFRSVIVREFDVVATTTLEEKAGALHAYLQFADGMPVLAYDRLDPEVTAFINHATQYYQVYSAPGGRLLTQSPGMESLGLHYTPAEVAEFTSRPGVHDVQTDSGRVRVITSVMRPHPGEAYVVQVGELLTAMDRSLVSFNRLLWVRIIGGILIAALLGRWLASRALAPLSRLATATQAIGIRTLHDRLEVRGTGDELDQVAVAFNGALARLEEAVGEMRQFSAAIAHEIRTPIAALRGEAEFELAHPLSVAERRERLLSQIEEYDRLTRLTNQILTLARAEAGEITLAVAPVALGPLVSSVIEQVEPVAEAQTVVLTSDMVEDVSIEGDTGWLERLLLILLDNAIKFTPEGGRVTVGVSRSGGEARLTVSDTGVGIPAEAMPRLFQRFYRLESGAPRRTSGAGLGLALAKWITERHRGRIDVTSSPGLGTTFVVTFPMVPDPARDAPRPMPLPAAAD